MVYVELCYKTIIITRGKNGLCGALLQNHYDNQRRERFIWSTVIKIIIITRGEDGVCGALLQNNYNNQRREWFMWSTVTKPL